MTHGSLFSGIGGFDLAADWMGWENVFHCEKNLFGRQILGYYWPEAISYDDIKTTDFTIHRGDIDILTGGFPCQPFSTAGKRKGTDDDRYLWPEMLRAIRQIQPRYVVGENVRGLTNWGGGLVFDEVQADLEAAGYEVLPFLLPAAGVNAPHRRDRIWFVAHARSCNSTISVQQRRQDKNANIDTNRQNESGAITNADDITRWPRTRGGNRSEVSNGNKRNASNTDSAGRKELDIPDFAAKPGHGSRCGNARPTDWKNFPTQPPVRCGNDGLSSRLDGITFSKLKNESVKAYGNAVVPHVAYQIFKAIDHDLRPSNTSSPSRT